jgi:drug/metabolite transporter (DMT)-like permease
MPLSPNISPNRFSLIIAGVLLMGIMAVSFASILIRWADAPALSIAFYRLLLASVVLSITHGRIAAAHLRRTSAKLIGFSGLSGLALAVHFAAWIHSLSLTSVASSVVLVATTPVWVAVGTYFILREPLHPTFIIGLLIAMSGAMFIGVLDTGTGADSLIGNALAVVGALAAAVYMLIGRRVQRELSTWAYVLATYGAAAVTLWLWALMARSPLLGFAWHTYGLFALIALVPQVIGHTSFNWALKHLSAPLVAVTLLGEPVGASALAYFLLDEKVSYSKMIAAVLTLGGVVIAAYSERMPSNRMLEKK